MKLVVTGKGGVGKTTITGILARLLSEEGQKVLALDVDSNPNLAFILGIPRETAERPLSIPDGMTEWRTDEEGKAYVYLRQPVEQFVSEYGMTAPGGVQLLVMGEVSEAGTGCRCEAHALARGLTHQVMAEADFVLMDMEPGLENLGRGTAEHVDALLIVIEPYYRSMMTASRIRNLASQLEIPQVFAVANRVRSPKELSAIHQYCRENELDLLAVIPYDEALMDAEEQGKAPYDFAPGSPAILAVAQLERELSARLGME
jgi:CO dehydrogenase maturation factor